MTTPPTSLTSPPHFIAPPPPEAKLPAVPEGFVPAGPSEFATVVPRKAELSALPQALLDLAQFADYAARLGTTAPPFLEMLQSLGNGAAWSLARQASAKWDGYASLQEGLSWKVIRAQMASLRPAFLLAAQHDPQLLVQYGGLAKLLDAKRAISQKGAAARRANREAVAAGELPLHGKVGKRRRRAAEKAALAAASKSDGGAASGS